MRTFGIAGCLTLFLVSCSSRENQRISVVGVWENKPGTEVLRFEKSGTFTISQGPNHTGQGSYEYLDDNVIKASCGFNQWQSKFKIVSQDLMEDIGPVNHGEEWRRVSDNPNEPRTEKASN